MSKFFQTENWDSKYQMAEDELIALFDKGVPFGVLDNDFESDQHFQFCNKAWNSEIESYMKKYEDCLSSIKIRELMERHLKELPETASVYWIHCVNYAFEAWVLGDIEAARECVRGKVKHELELEPICWDMTEEDVEFINSSYAIEKIAVGVNSTYTAKNTSRIPVGDDIWERIVFNPNIKIDD